MNPLLIIIGVGGLLWALFKGEDDEDGPERPGLPDDSDLSPDEPGVMTGLIEAVTGGDAGDDDEGPGGIGGLSEATFDAGAEPGSTPDPFPPPNVGGVGDYNESLYPDIKSVRRGLSFLGYGLIADSQDPIPEPIVRQFQGDYNQASILGKWDTSGWLDEDGIAGMYTLRALEIAATGLDGADLFDLARGYQWGDYFSL